MAYQPIQNPHPVVGNVAHDAADSSNPVKTGARAVSLGATPTAVTAADRTDHIATRHGIPFVLGGHPNIVTVEFDRGTSAGTDVALVTVSSGTSIVVTRVSAHVSAACSVNVAVRIGFATATLPALSATGATGILLSAASIPPAGGIVEGTGAGILGIGGSDEDIRITHGATTSGKLRVVISYFTIDNS